MTDLREAAQQALEALEAFLSDELRPYEAAKTAANIRAVLAQQAEPVAWLQPRSVDGHLRPDLGYETCSPGDYLAFPVYTAPTQQTPLTDEEIDTLWRAPMSADWEHREFARAIERAHGIGEQR